MKVLKELIRNLRMNKIIFVTDKWRCNIRKIQIGKMLRRSLFSSGLIPSVVTVLEKKRSRDFELKLNRNMNHKSGWKFDGVSRKLSCLQEHKQDFTTFSKNGTSGSKVKRSLITTHLLATLRSSIPKQAQKRKSCLCFCKQDTEDSLQPDFDNWKRGNVMNGYLTE